MNLRIDEEEYELFREVEGTGDMRIINKGLRMINQMINVSPLVEELNKVPFDGVYAYESNDINAIARKEGGTYAIALSFGLFIRIDKWFKLWEVAPLIDSIFNFEDDEGKKRFFDNCYAFAIIFIACHELYHILNGHCDLKKKTNVMSETRKESVINDNLFNQILEYDADCCAARYCAALIMNQNSIESAIAQTLRNLIFSVYNVFLMFCEIDQMTFEELLNEDIDAFDHPHPSIRLAYSVSMVADYVMNYWRKDQVIQIFSMALNECIAFDRILAEHESLKKSLVAFAYTSKGTDHMKELNNRWKNVSKKLREYAFVPLRPYSWVSKIPVWVDDNGEFMMIPEGRGKSKKQDSD